MRGSRGSQENTRGYRGLQLVKGNYRLVLFILKLFSEILDFIYKTFSIFLFF